MGDRNPISSAFADWLHQAGVKTHGIEAAFVSEGWRGIAATQEIPAGAMLLQVPKEALMSADSALTNSDFAAKVSQHGPHLSHEQVLCIHLLHEAALGVTSSWQHYIAQLPTDYTLLMNFRKRHIEALQLSHAQSIAQGASDQAQEQWSAAQTLLQALGLSSKWRSYKAWLWAASTVCSRTMHVPFSPGGALTPFGDLHNYQPPPAPHYPEIDGVELPASNTDEGPGQECGDGGYHEAFNEYCLYARRRYKPGEQVFLCYGKYTNLELLEHYGFTLADNPHDTAPLPISAFPCAIAAYMKQQGSSSGHRYLHSNGVPSWQLLQELRCCVASAAEKKKSAHLAAAGMRISAAGDMKVFQALQGACLTILKGLGTSLKQDVELQKQAASEPCLHAVVSWRICYKR